jgi:hypothetical protein
MKTHLKFRPDLQASELEDRLLPVISNLGVMVLTTGGYVLVTPFPGVSAYPGGSPGGAAIPTSFVMTGSGGISSMQPGNSAGVPGLATTAPSASNAGSSATVSVGSGANDASGLNIEPVTRNTIANDNLNPPPRIGSVFGDRSAALPPGQFYRGGLRVTAPAGTASEAPGGQVGRIPGRRPVDPSSVGLRSAPHRLSADPSADPIKRIADRVP